MWGARVGIIVCDTHPLVVEPSYYQSHFVGSAADYPPQGFPAILPILQRLWYKSIKKIDFSKFTVIFR